MVSLNNNERQVRNMGVLTLFDDLKVIYVFNYMYKVPVCVFFFFVTDFTAAQQDFKYLYFIFSCTCPLTIYIDHANKDVFSEKIVKLFYYCPDLRRK